VPTAAPRIRTLDALRGIAALCVFVYHAQYPFPVISNPFTRGSWMVVDLFFVLSGFVLAGAVGRAGSGGRAAITFLRRRVARLLPLHLVVLAFLIAVELGRLALQHAGLLHPQVAPFSGTMAASAIPPNALLVGAVAGPDLSWNQPSWTTSVQVMVNAGAATLALLGPRVRLAAFAATALLAAVGLWLTLTPTGTITHGPVAVLRGGCGFSIGILLARLPHPTLSARLWTVLECIAVVGALLAMLHEPLMTELHLLPEIALLAVPVWVFAAGRGRLGRLIACRPLVVLGRWSFGLYLWHVAVLYVLVLAAERTLHSGVEVLAAPVQLLLVATALVVSVVASATTFRLVERRSG
jgi:peptidoglycan/LPS O-acetylase OafA/YrhL